MRRACQLPLFAILTCSPMKVTAALVQEITFENAGQPGTALKLAGLNTLTSSFLQNPDTAPARTALADAILTAYQDAGWPVTSVEIIPKSRTHLAASVTEGRYGQIAVEGGTPWMRQAIASGWQHQPGSALSMQDLMDGLAWTHRNPLHAVTAAFAPGEATATADLTLTLQNARPWHFFSSWRNDGIPILGEHRFSFGAELADPFGLPVWLSAEALTSEDTGAFQGARSTLRTFFPWRHELRLSGQWIHGEAEVSLPGFAATSSLETWSASGRYLVPMPAWHDWQREIGAGLDFFQSTSGVDVGGLRAEGTAISWDMAVEASAGRTSGPHRTSLRGEILWSPGGNGGPGGDAAHAALRPGASADYFMFRGQFLQEYEWSGGWRLTGLLNSQWSSAPVLPIQSFYAAGSQGVRGYDEAVTLGDSGVAGNLELHLPALLPGKSPFTLEPIAFLDGGWVRNEVSGKDTSVASSGAGIRLRWGQHATLSCDYGWRLTEPGGRAHLGLRIDF